MPEKEEILTTQRQSWNKFSNGWKKWDGFIAAWMGPVGEKLIETANIKDGDKVLDAATGTGEPGVTVAERFSKGEVIGADVSEDMVRLAKETAGERGVKNFSAVVAATSQLPFEDNSFDAAICRFGVIFAPDVLADIKELTRVVKQGSSISVSSWNEPSKNPWALVIPKIIKEVTQSAPTPSPSDAPGLFRCAGPTSLSSLMTEAGLSNVSQVEVTGEMELESPEQYWEIMMDIAAPIVGALANASEDVQKAVREKTLEVLRANHMRDGKVVMPWSAWVASGSK